MSALKCMASEHRKENKIYPIGSLTVIENGTIRQTTDARSPIKSFRVAMSVSCKVSEIQRCIGRKVQFVKKHVCIKCAAVGKTTVKF